jgi:ABC-2 type transport system permease protein
VWLVRNQNLMEMWWIFTTLMRYPRGIYDGTFAKPFGWFFTFVVPALVVVDEPAEVMVKVLDPIIIAWTCFAAFLMCAASRFFFRYALRSYRSASS